jgi:hypothetical protein
LPSWGTYDDFLAHCVLVLRLNRDAGARASARINDLPQVSGELVDAADLLLIMQGCK